MTGLPVTPTLNINGTSTHDLLEQIHAAIEALDTASRAVQEAGPHGRDYQTEPESYYRIARHQHTLRLTRLNDVRQELMTIWEGIYFQDQARKKRQAS